MLIIRKVNFRKIKKLLKNTDKVDISLLHSMKIGSSFDMFQDGKFMRTIRITGYSIHKIFSKKYNINSKYLICDIESSDDYRNYICFKDYHIIPNNYNNNRLLSII